MAVAAKTSNREPTYLIVLTLRDGRNFPYNAHEQIIAEAKFGTNTLTTDPKKYEVAPHFDEELCWSTTPRALHDHKLRRTPIKITAYGWDARTAKRQQIGYITLDIRTYLTRDRFEWHPLVGVPYMREKPELQLSIKCEEDDIKPSLGTVFNDFGDTSPTSGPSPPGFSKSFSSSHASQMPPTLNNAMPSRGPPSLTVASSSSSIASRTSLKLQRRPSVSNSNNDRLQPDVATSSTQRRKSLTRSSSHASSLGSLARRNTIDAKDNNDVGSANNSRPPSSSGTYERRDENGAAQNSTNKNDAFIIGAEQTSAKQLYYGSNQLPSSASNSMQQPVIFPEKTASPVDMRPRNNGNTDKNFSSSQQAHHFCCTINLFSITLTSSQVRKNVFLYARYTYSFFGTSSPIITRPSVEVPPRSEKRFNNGYCSFSFACTRGQMHRAFECVPLTVEIYSTNTASRDCCIGVTKIPLSTLLQQPKNQTLFNNNEQENVFRQQFDGLADIVDVINEESQQPLGRLHYKLCMDDYGPLQDGGSVLPPSSAENHGHKPNGNSGGGNMDETLTFDAVCNMGGGGPNHPRPVPMPATGTIDQFQHNSMPPHAPMVNGFPTMPSYQSNPTTERILAANGRDAQFRFDGDQFRNSNSIPTQPPPTNTNVYNLAARYGNENQLYSNAVPPQHSNSYAPVAVNNRAHASGDRAGGSAYDPPPVSSYTPRTHTPPTRNELGRVNPGGAGSNVTEHESLLVNELMKLRLQKMEMQAAMELEVWKEEEERKFSNYLKQKEQESLKILADEWRRRDKEREHLFDERRSAYEQQESKLKSALDTVSARERQLADIEKELAFREEKLLNERDALDAHKREVEERISRTFESKLENEKIITENLRRLLKENEERLGKVEKRVDEKEQECSDLRDKLAERPEHQLRSQMEILKVEKRELEARVREAMEQANHFKSQWSKAMADLHRVRVEERQSSDGRMKALSREVEQLKMALTKETRTLMSKKHVVGENHAAEANVNQQHSERSDAGQHRHDTASGAGSGSADEQRRPYANNDNVKQQEALYAASTGARSAGSTSAYEESDDAESVVIAPDYRRSSQHPPPPGTSRRKQPQQRSGAGSNNKKYDADEMTDDEEMRARKQELLKLMDERNVLLKTGIYSPDDEMIRDLNKKIRELEEQLIDDGVSIPDA